MRAKGCCCLSEVHANQQATIKRRGRVQGYAARAAQGRDKVSLPMESKKTYGSPWRLTRVLLTSMLSFISPPPWRAQPAREPISLL
jgi:hypothetical protein